MKPIQPVSVWFNGVETQANRFNLYVINDNLVNTASFYYSLLVETEVTTTTSTTSEEPGPIPPTPGPAMNQIVQAAQGNLTMTGQEYIDWNQDPDINEAAFVWAAGKLNLTLV